MSVIKNIFCIIYFSILVKLKYYKVSFRIFFTITDTRSCSSLGLPVVLSSTVWQVSLELNLGVVIVENHIETSVFLLFSEFLTSNFFGLGDGMLGSNNIGIILPWVFLLRTFWWSCWSSVESINNFSISIRVINGTLWPDFSPVSWLFLHESWIWDTS